MSGFQLQADMYNSITPSEIEVRNLEERLKELENKVEELKNERPKGKWIKESKLWGGFGDSVLVNTCSECGESFIYHGNNPNYCPNCGAYMRGDDYGS